MATRRDSLLPDSVDEDEGRKDVDSLLDGAASGEESSLKQEEEDASRRTKKAPSGGAVPLTLKMAKGRKRSVPSALTRTFQQKGETHPHAMRRLLEKTRTRHHAYAAMHAAAGRSAASIHKNFTVAILTTTLVTTLATNLMQEDLIDPRWTTLVSNASLALVAGLTAINNFLGYQKRGAEHREIQNSHLGAAELIDIAIACDDENPNKVYNYTSVLEEIQEIHKHLKKATVGIPAWVAKKYPEYEAPWLLRKSSPTASDDLP
ncbi:hypothetical protein ElyMa_002595300 [Elysia marginata]|uniref:SMODS and SLOG-associating 2TM effector domain-containing protein n=1 Tax=Elysia marginata TaxID=1093978 RepID=A0AAV4H414_9GAST|nr:hypothetical protein ElyMa_002595300 [Elysia marginata]